MPISLKGGGPMLELKIQTSHRQYIAPADLVRVLGPAQAMKELGDMIEHLIAQLDGLTGDPDLEDDDPAGDPLDIGEAPADTEVLAMLPRYGLDQSRGPINERPAYEQHLRLICGGQQ